MQTDTGKIVMMDSSEAKEAALRERLTQLTQKEHALLLNIEEKDRPVELAVTRFIEERKRLKAPHGDGLKHRLQAAVFALARELVHLQEAVVRALLNFDQVRNLDGTNTSF